ncbi:MAG: ATP-binding protein [Desulfobacterales bacterium]|nr:ATP-binding protein [Desulfobacteraceae bacterium]MDD3991189.1 ATP-binding protein [Desulfobacteraceae bacterium]MDY0312871.1 ATP-binding protein [Desulfobacterales bacterium]
MTVQRLPATAVYHACDIEALSFDTTSQIAPLESLSNAMGQPRAVDSLQFGTGMRRTGFNIFVLGPSGTGRHSLVRQILGEKAKSSPTPSDWCYVNNFENPGQPKALELPPGQGKAMAADMKKMITEVRSTLKASFESEAYQNRIQSVQQTFKEQQQEAFKEVSEKAKAKQLVLIRTPQGLALAPMKADGEIMPPDEFQQLPEVQRKEIEEKIEEIEEESRRMFQKIPQWQKEIGEKLEALNIEVAKYAITPLIDAMRAKYGQTQKISAHMDAVEKDILANLPLLMTSGEHGGEPPSLKQGVLGAEASEMASPALRRYRVNPVVDHSQQTGAPVVFEDNPTYANLVGKVEHMSQMGVLMTDFNLVKAGALHRANGGALVLDARKVLTHPGAWEGLKRALKSEQIKIESLAEMFSLLSTVMLEPEPIPLEVKVVMIGSAYIYYLLQDYDPEFEQLFKIAADFDVEMPRDENSENLYARLLRTIIERERLLHFDRGAVGRIIEESARMAGDAERLSTKIRDISDLMVEADVWARKDALATVGRSHVQQAVDARIFRSDRVRQRIQEEIRRGTLLIDVEGGMAGQVNGLAVIQLGRFTFGWPHRITARIQMGKGELIDIERESKLGGPLHSKGVLILSGFLGARYAREHPLALKASLVFEQSYGMVEGDSASSTELYALLSAISGIPIQQGLAVTGSVNQFGQIQAIGGVNEKIEGFFDVCRNKGLNGRQGVLIPAANVKHLMLRADVVAAIREERFHVYPVTTVDEGMTLLTGMPAGEPDEHHRYPEDTVNGQIQLKLTAMAEKMKKFSQPAPQGGPSESGQ